MKLQFLQLREFRNCTDTALTPDPHLNFLVGQNAQGKTSLLEAIYLLATLRSFRDGKVQEWMRFGSARTQIEGRITDSVTGPISDQSSASLPWSTELTLSFERRSPSRPSKIARINQKPYPSSSQYLLQRFHSYGQGFHAVVFNPADHDLVRGEPVLRRRFLDQALTAQHPGFITQLQTYQRLLLQRNALLKQGAQGRGLSVQSKAALESFTEQWVKAAAWIYQQRLVGLEELQPYFRAHYAQISGQPESEVQLRYIASGADHDHFTGQGSCGSLELLERAIEAKIQASQALESRMGYTLMGPHRDDWSVELRGLPLKGQGSQGEVRSVLLALKLSEIALFRKKTGHRPVFLLDDFSSELDERRRSFLLDFLSQSDLQTFITTTESFTSQGKIFQISNGTVKEGKA
jgi:DNA replication and repair protein RecF